jgi:L-ascorbate metabolism protein UlaG (beta-lactamase superfamily)
MQLTKLGHACVRLSKNGGTLVIDPGVWSGPDVLTGAAAVLVTHEHADHLDADAVRAALAANSDVELWSTPSVADEFGEFGARVHAVSHGDTFSAAGFDVHVYGRDHARIVAQIPVIGNVAFGVDGTVFHPGDSFTVPEDSYPVLLVPVSIAAAAPQRGYAIHDAILSEFGIGLVGNLVKLVSGGNVSRVGPGTTVDL